MPTEPGNYYGTVKQAVTSKAQTGSPQVVVAFNVTHHAVADKWVELSEPMERSMFLNLHQNTKAYTQEKLRILDFDGNFDEPGLTKEGVALTCRHETYEGKTRERWELTAYQGGDFNPEKTDAETIRTLNAWWAATRGGKPEGAPSAPSGKDIPF